jgi:RNA polymerase sigma-70 factor (sigma-E family)
MGMGSDSQPLAAASRPGPPPSQACGPPASTGSPVMHPPVRRQHADGWAGQVRDDSAAAVTALYQTSALRMVRLAHVLIGDRATAEDIVQDAFSGLYRRWEYLTDQGKALSYVRSAVLNSCRSVLRRRPRAEVVGELPDASLVLASAEVAVLTEEERRAVMAALRRLPSRQREVLVLRFYLDMSESEIAQEMGIAKSTVRSAQHRALAALGRMLREAP